MAQLGLGNGTGYPSAIDTSSTEVDSPSASKTKVRAGIANDLYAAAIALETELGTDPAGDQTDVKTRLANSMDDSGFQKWKKGADIASASALTLGTDGNAFDVTGTTTINTISTRGVGAMILLQFDGVLTLTDSAADLVLPDGDITTAAGDIATFHEYAAGNWRLVTYNRAAAIAGTVAVADGGTGQTTYTNGQLLIGNTTGNTLAKSTLTGTANQVTVTNGTGTITLSIPDPFTPGGQVNMEDNTLSRPKIIDYGETINILGDLGGGTDDIDLTLGNVVTATVSTSAETFTFSNPPASGTLGSFTLILTNGGSQTVNWPASVDWAGGTAPTLTAAGIDVLTFITADGGTIWYGFAGGLDMQ